MLVLAMCLITLAPLAAGYSTGVLPAVTDTTDQTLMPTVTEPTTQVTVMPPVTEPTSSPTTEQTVMPTVTAPTSPPTTEQTITLPTSPVGGDQGWIDVYCNVDGATVYFDGVPQGTTAGGLLSVAVFVTGSPVGTISVSKSGYTTWTGSLSSMPAVGQHVAVYATINPLTTIPTPVPPVMTGAIYTQSSPAGAAIYMNGNFYGYSPLTIPALAPGSYSMRATLAGYTSDNSLITVYVGQTAPYYPVLQQSPQPRPTGSVYVTSIPSQASIYVDGSYYGTTPLTVTLYPGSHQIVLKSPGYNDYSAGVWVSAGQAQNLPVTLSTATQGTVVITSVPYASVFIDSNTAGTISSSGTLTLTGINAGNHIFKVTSPGYNSWLNTVYIQASTVNTISAPLTPIGTNPTIAPATGGLAIASSPSGAETYVDSLYRGSTPLTVTGLAPGDHLVRVSSSGYVDYTTTTTVISGQTSPLAITLSAAPAPTATPSPAPTPGLVICAGIAASGIWVLLRRRC